MLNDEIEAFEQRINPVTIGVPDLRGGQQRLDVRFIQFDNMVLELLHYREKSQPLGSGAAWPPAHDHRSPAYPRSLHLCFHLRDDIDFNTFVRDLEAESMRRGMTNVRCNRIVSVTTEEGRECSSEHDVKQDHRGEVEWMGFDLCPRTRGRGARICPSIGPSQTDLRRSANEET